MNDSMLMISIPWWLDWRVFYELPRGNDVLYISLSLLVHHECPSLNLLLPGHQPMVASDSDVCLSSVFHPPVGEY